MTSDEFAAMDAEQAARMARFNRLHDAEGPQTPWFTVSPEAVRKLAARKEHAAEPVTATGPVDRLRRRIMRREPRPRHATTWQPRDHGW